MADDYDLTSEYEDEWYYFDGFFRTDTAEDEWFDAIVTFDLEMDRLLFVSADLIDQAIDRRDFLAELHKLRAELGAILFIVMKWDGSVYRQPGQVAPGYREWRIPDPAWFLEDTPEARLKAVLDEIEKRKKKSAYKPIEMAFAFVPPANDALRRSWVTRTSSMAVKGLFEVETLEPGELHVFMRQKLLEIRRMYEHYWGEVVFEE